MSAAESVLNKFVAAIDHESLGAYGVYVMVAGDVAQHRWRSDDRVNIYSASKAVSALAVGLATQGVVFRSIRRFGSSCHTWNLGRGSRK